jgi:hypothetical protein
LWLQVVVVVVPFLVVVAVQEGTELALDCP